MPELLHAEYLDRIPVTGGYIADRILHCAGDVAIETQYADDPDVSVVIRSRNNADQLERLLQDVEKQDFNGGVELIVVDTESSDRSLQVARSFGAAIVPMCQRTFNYPKGLNYGFATASNKWIFSLVDHSLLAHDQVLKIATRSEAHPNLAGVSGITLPNANASHSELNMTALVFPNMVRKPAHLVEKAGMGTLSTNCSMVNRDAWQELGGFNEAFGAGGEDLDLAKRLLASGADIITDPAMAVHHTHGTGFKDSVRQVLYWAGVSKPRAFDLTELARFRSEYRGQA